jgi:hypothetical protein
MSTTGTQHFVVCSVCYVQRNSIHLATMD